jgi:hypothetical protein
MTKADDDGQTSSVESGAETCTSSSSSTPTGVWILRDDSIGVGGRGVAALPTT